MEAWGEWEDDPANEAREKSKGEKELDEGEGGRRLSEGERREPREKATVAVKALRIDPGRERKNQQRNERTTEEELRARKERTSQVESMRREEGRILTELLESKERLLRVLACLSSYQNVDLRW
jgi:hypothetical protein